VQADANFACELYPRASIAGGKITISAFGARSGRTPVLMYCLPRTSIQWWQRQYDCDRRTSGSSGSTVTLTGSAETGSAAAGAARRWEQSEELKKLGSFRKNVAGSHRFCFGGF
jgi:hypothetical protein